MQIVATYPISETFAKNAEVDECFGYGVRRDTRVGGMVVARYPISETFVNLSDLDECFGYGVRSDTQARQIVAKYPGSENQRNCVAKKLPKFNT